MSSQARKIWTATLAHQSGTLPGMVQIFLRQMWKTAALKEPGDPCSAFWDTHMICYLLLQFIKTYPILHNHFKRISYFEGSFSNWLVFEPLSCTKPMAWNPIIAFRKVKHLAPKILRQNGQHLKNIFNFYQKF